MMLEDFRGIKILEMNFILNKSFQRKFLNDNLFWGTFLWICKKPFNIILNKKFLRL